MIYLTMRRMRLPFNHGRDDVQNVDIGDLILHIPTRSKSRQFFLHNGRTIWASGWSLEELVKDRFIKLL